MIEYLASQYVPENTVIAVAGDVTHERVVGEIQERVGGWGQAPFASWAPSNDGQTARRVGLRSKRTEQAQILLGFPAYSAMHPDRYVLDMLNTVLGEGMSSRLFVEVRENRGLAYDVHSSVARYTDTGAFVVGVGVDPKKATECIRAVRGEIDRIRSEPVPEAELTKCKEYVKGRMQLRMEDSRAVSSWVGGQELLRGEIRSVDDVLADVEAVTAADIQRVAQDVIRDERANLAVVGPFRSVDRFDRLLT
jgi:predicted Zn-dependent peptidase